MIKSYFAKCFVPLGAWEQFAKPCIETQNDRIAKLELRITSLEHCVDIATEILFEKKKPQPRDKGGRFRK